MKNRPCRGLNMAIRTGGTPRKRRGYTNAETARKVLKDAGRSAFEEGEGDYDGLTCRLPQDEKPGWKSIPARRFPSVCPAAHKPGQLRYRNSTDHIHNYMLFCYKRRNKDQHCNHYRYDLIPHRYFFISPDSNTTEPACHTMD